MEKAVEKTELTVAEQIETALAAKRQRQTELKAEIAAIDDQAATLREKYKAAVESGEDDAKLDAMDKALYQLDRQRTRVEIRLNQCGVEIEQLQHNRVEAHAAQEREKYEQDTKAALDEAKDIEKIVQGLMTVAGAHATRLDRMRRFCEGAGALQVSYKMATLERRIQTLFNGGHSLNGVYRKPYDELLQSSIDAVERQLLNRTAEPIAGDAEAPQQSAVND